MLKTSVYAIRTFQPCLYWTIMMCKKELCEDAPIFQTKLFALLINFMYVKRGYNTISPFTMPNIKISLQYSLCKKGPESDNTFLH